MSSFRDISFEPPGYPIYRAFIIPYRRGGGLHDVVEVGPEEVELWRRMLESLRAFLLNAVESLEEGGADLKDYERLELVGDLISLFLRAPLNREVLPGVLSSPLKAYALMRLMRLEELFKEQEFDLIGFTYTFYSAHLRKYLSEEQHPKLSKALRDLEALETSNNLESCWLLIPADTRPALNTAGLLPHLLLTSAIAWSTAVDRGVGDRRAVARLRLAALLHDIAKPFKYRDHVRASAEVAKRLLSGLLPKEDVDFISECIMDHHAQRTEQGKVIGEADRTASAIDRLRRLVDESSYFMDIRRRLESAARALNYGSLDEAFNDWDFWCKVYEKYDRELIRSLSEEFVSRVRKVTKNFTTLPPEVEAGVGRAEPAGLAVLLIDVGGVQSFIYRSHSLRQVAAASLVIDTLVMAYIVAYLQWAMGAKCWLPYEAFLYTAGGNVELLVPRALADDVKDRVSRLSRRLMRDYGITLYVADAELRKDRAYSETVRELMAKMSVSKVHVKREEYPAVVPRATERGVRSVCQSCFMEVPSERLSTPEGEVAVCKLCYGLHEIGLNIHFMERYESRIGVCGRTYRPSEVFGMPWGGEGARIKASERIMEIIAGHDYRELQELGRLARTRNIAVVKVDGVLMGPLMATCLSIADAYERSARIDMALKKSIEAAISEVYNGVSRALGEIEAAKAALSIKMGVLYAGGDDAVILAPSWASPLIALVLGKEFLYNLGRVRGLSIGVAVASPKADIWALIDASLGLMRKAKERARRGVEEGSAESALCFDVVEAGDLSSSTIDERLRTLRREKLTAQPFSVDAFEEVLWKILGQALEQECSKEYGEVARLAYLASRSVEVLRSCPGVVEGGLVEQIERMQDRLKDVRRSLSETLQAARSVISKAGDVRQYGEYALPIAYVYACRQLARVGGRQYEFVRSLIPDRLGDPSSLSDVDRIIKIIGGGVI